MQVVPIERDGVFEEIVLTDAALESCKTGRTV
jgi:hypothetical protein